MIRHIAVTTRENRRRYQELFNHLVLPKVRLSTAREIAQFYRSEGLGSSGQARNSSRTLPAAAPAEVIIAKAGKPIAKLVPLSAAGETRRRHLDILAGQAVVPADFDAPLPDAVLDAFDAR